MVTQSHALGIYSKLAGVIDPWRRKVPHVFPALFWQPTCLPAKAGRVLNARRTRTGYATSSWARLPTLEGSARRIVWLGRSSTASQTRCTPPTGGHRPSGVCTRRNLALLMDQLLDARGSAVSRSICDVQGWASLPPETRGACARSGVAEHAHCGGPIRKVSVQY